MMIEWVKTMWDFLTAPKYPIWMDRPDADKIFTALFCDDDWKLESNVRTVDDGKS